VDTGVVPFVHLRTLMRIKRVKCVDLNEESEKVKEMFRLIGSLEGNGK